MKEIYRDEVNTWLETVMEEIRKNATLTKLEDEGIFLTLEHHIDELLDYPDYKNYN